MIRGEVGRYLKKAEGPLLTRVLLLAATLRKSGITPEVCLREIGSPIKYGVSGGKDAVKFYAGYLHHKEYNGFLVRGKDGRYRITEKGIRRIEELYYTIKEVREQWVQSVHGSVAEAVVAGRVAANA